MYSKNCMLSTRVYLDNYNQSYKNIIVINLIPEGPLKSFVRRFQMPKLSPFEYHQGSCVFALKSFRTCGIMCDEEIPDLFSFLAANNYKINTSLTKMMNTSPIKLENNTILCFIEYIGI